jgi:hypothetical protein
VSRKIDPSNINDDWFEDPLECRRLAGVAEEMLAHQLFWADPDGNMPWDEGPHAMTLRWLQPPLYQPNIRPSDERPKKEGLRHRAEVLTLCNPSA